jgi:hypothetical protein
MDDTEGILSRAATLLRRLSTVSAEPEGNALTCPVTTDTSWSEKSLKHRPSSLV